MINAIVLKVNIRKVRCRFFVRQNTSKTLTMLKEEMTYDAYRALMDELVAEQKTTGEEQSEARIHYTSLNHKRMQRLDKKGQLSEEQEAKIKAFDKPVEWVVLTESWCGDAAQTLPFMNKMAEVNDHIDLKIVLRDKNLSLMDEHLTNGGRAIPKLIMRDQETKEVIDTYGPRPSVATKMVIDFKTKEGKLTDEFKKDLQLWYTKDKGQNTINDLLKLLN